MLSTGCASRIELFGIEAAWSGYLKRLDVVSGRRKVRGDTALYTTSPGSLVPARRGSRSLIPESPVAAPASLTLLRISAPSAIVRRFTLSVRTPDRTVSECIRRTES